MKIVIAPDSYKESLSALEVAGAIERGFREIYPDADYHKLPVADGGEGTVEAMVAATQGRIVEVDVTGPLGDTVKGFYGLSGDEQSAFYRNGGSQRAGARTNRQTLPADHNVLGNRGADPPRLRCGRKAYYYWPWRQRDQ
jgi:glycerate 2-kinase (EC 2.7.1.-)